MDSFTFDRELVARTIKDRRIRHEALAEAVGLTHKSAVPKILKGERQVKVGEAAKIYDYLKLVATGNPVRSVPIIGFASAGNWREAVSMPLGRMMLPEQIAGARAFAVEVKGDSIDQLVADGGWIVVDPDDKALAANKVYLIQNAEYETTVKRYQKGPARFEPVSSNTDHKAFLASDQDFMVLGRVVWKGEGL